jgi:hypothetical protein
MRRTAAGLVALFAQLALVVSSGPALEAQAPAQAAAQASVAKAAPARTSARTWTGRNAEFEEYLRTAAIDRIVEVPIGVTKPKRAYFAGGGLVESAAWKVLPPGRHNGFWDSYKSEMAAYELDKVLGMGMVPPAVERQYKGDVGALVLWLSPVHPWKDMEAKPKPPSWARQAVDMKMFDNLIGNKDRNAGNFLIDDDWNLFLIDHSRAFISDKDLPWEMVHVDRPLWKKMLALDEATLTSALSKWVGKGEIRAILARRDKMQKTIDALVKKKGEAAVFVD